MKKEYWDESSGTYPQSVKEYLKLREWELNRDDTSGLLTTEAYGMLMKAMKDIRRIQHNTEVNNNLPLTQKRYTQNLIK